MSLQPKTSFTPKDYLEMERKAEFKSEYFNGEIYPMMAGRFYTYLLNKVKSHFSKRNPLMESSNSI